MLKNFSVYLTLAVFCFNTLSANAYYYDTDNYETYESIEKGDTYCNPKKTFVNRIKSAFAGQMTGFTPQIQPSPYLTPSYGPSYMQGYYSGNQWNSHNIYSPSFAGAKLFGTSF